MDRETFNEIMLQNILKDIEQVRQDIKKTKHDIKVIWICVAGLTVSATIYAIRILVEAFFYIKML